MFNINVSMFKHPLNSKNLFKLLEQARSIPEQSYAWGRFIKLKYCNLFELFQIMVIESIIKFEYVLFIF